MLTVDVVSDPAAFAALKDDWNTLADRFATPLHRFEWFEAGWNAFGEGTGPSDCTADGRAGLWISKAHHHRQ